MADWQEAIKKLEALKASLPKLVGNEMVNFALDNIRSESFEGKKWKPRKPGTKRNSGRNLLVDTGRGRRSIRISKSSTLKTELDAIDYMQAHNEGVKKTVSVRGYSRKGRSVKPHSMKMNLPQRQFTGVSNEQTRRINLVIQQQIIKALQ